MIVDFTVANFRSIRDETTLSFFVEHPGSRLLENIAYPPASKMGALRTLGVYGANASGKSNLLRAMEAFQYLVQHSGNLRDGAPIPCYEPFRLSKSTRDAPVRFDVEFFTPDGVRYSYKVAFTKHRITHEQLVVYPSRQPAVLFSREDSDTWETIKLGNAFKGRKRRFALFGNNAYLSKAGNSADAPESVRSVFNYFRQDVICLNPIALYAPRVRDVVPERFRFASALLAAADTGITEITLKERDISKLAFPNGTPDDVKTSVRKAFAWQPLCSHVTDAGEFEQFEMEDESAGTQRLFHLAPVIASAFARGGVVLLDELESGMHPLMAELIIRLFHDPKVNTKGAQLIFTTHNAHVMSPELFRRDQIWFAEKNEGVSRFFSLADFDKNVVKSTSPFSRWYLEGRFDALPKIDYRRIVDALVSTQSSDAQEEH